MEKDTASAGNSNKLNAEKMRDLADYLKSEIPGCGFALIAFEIENGASLGNYISNVTDEFMIKALEFQVKALKNKNSLSGSEVSNSGS